MHWRNDRFEELDADAAPYVAAASGTRSIDLTPHNVDEARAAYEARRMGELGEAPPIARTDDVELVLATRTLHTRRYMPEEDDTPAPVLVYLHGGGWVFGSLDTHDTICRRLAAGSGCAVLSLDYRLAPRNPFPAALDDVIETIQWLGTHGMNIGLDPCRMAIGGDSAGGNLAAAASLALREADGPKPLFQLLIYPALDLTMGRPSHREFGQGYLLDSDFQRRCHELYLGGADRRDWRISPLLAEDVTGVPPAFVLTASHDPLRDEAEAYAARLVAAGVPVTVHRVPGQVHAFMAMDGVMRIVAPTARLLARHLALALRDRPW